MKLTEVADKEMMDTKEVAALLGYTKTRIKQFVDEGKLVPLRMIGNSYMFSRAAVEALPRKQEDWRGGRGHKKSLNGKQTQP